MRGCNQVHHTIATIRLLITRPASLASLLVLAIALSGCASSKVSRDVSANVDIGINNTNKLSENFSNGDVIESYQNSSNATKGALLGGATGMLAGAASSTVGFVPGAVVGAILGASYGSYIDSQATIEDQLTNRGATIIVLGDQIMVVIPSARIFEGMTDKIKTPAYSTLNLLTAYINQYPNVMVKISAYTDDIGEKKVNLAVSDQQAQKVLRYLTANNLNTRLLYAQGFGGTNLVMKNPEDWGRSDNYRLEITMEKLYV